MTLQSSIYCFFLGRGRNDDNSFAHRVKRGTLENNAEYLLYPNRDASQLTGRELEGFRLWCMSYQISEEGNTFYWKTFYLKKLFL